DVEVALNPSGLFDELRAQSWLVRSAFGGVVIGRAQVQALLADRRLRSPVTQFIEMQGVADGLVHDRMCRTPLAIDGDDHTRVRNLVRGAFAPKAVDRHRPLMRAILETLVGAVAQQGRCEFMAAVSEHYPIQVMCHVLGVPVEDHEDFARWINAIAWSLSIELVAHREEAEWGMKELDDYTSGLIADRRAHPRDDLATVLVQAEEDGDRLSDEELRSLIIGLLFAGYDTTRNQLGLALWVFAHHPEQWALLADTPDLARRAVEEVMRFRGSVSTAPRLVAEDFEFDGYRLEAGTLLFLSTSAANHDPATYDQPDVFDITAARDPQLTFGGGPHFCLGAQLARAELQEALKLLAQRLPGLELDGEPTWRPNMGIFGPETLPIRFVPSQP
ncbi:MAG: cytochrome P450, partial [Acidimicrobiia bacterium]|nr:cytochrome P450 [Acidimicrobiia bacterium]